MPSWFGVVICRFLSGFGLGGVLVSSTTIMMEEWPSKSRASYMGYLSISIPIGIFSAGLIDYFITSWRIAFFIGIFPILLAIIAFWILKESDKWLTNKSEANQKNHTEDFIFSRKYRNNLVAGTIIFGSMLIGLWAVFLWLPTWIQSFFTLRDAAKERGISMMVLGCGGLIGGVFSGSLINWIGAKRSILISFLFAVLFQSCYLRPMPVFLTSFISKLQSYLYFSVQVRAFCLSIFLNCFRSKFVQLRRDFALMQGGYLLRLPYYLLVFWLLN